MGEPSSSAWDSFPCLEAVFCCLRDAPTLAQCAAVCRGWRQALSSSNAPWAAALEHEYGPQGAADKQAARASLIAARTCRLFVAGTCPAGLGCRTAGARFTSPEPLLLGSSSSSSPGRLAVKAVAAGADFAVILTWHGAVLDTRCLVATAGGGAAAAARQGCLDWSGLWRPPSGRPVAVAAGGCWQGNGRPGGHVLAVTDEGAVWAWGGNAAGQLGAAGGALPAWVPAPLEVVNSAAAAAMGGPTAAACGDEHSALLCRSGRVYAAGSNAAGACGLPIVQLSAAQFSAVPLPPGEQAAALDCGCRSLAVVTRRGRLLTCGANEAGQAGARRQGGACFLLSDVGPSAAWHGMQRVGQLPAGGGGEEAGRAVGVACGGGTLYILTDAGEVFSCGQGPQGELGLGGTSKTVCTPSRMPWAHGAARLAASCSGGRCAAVIDGQGRLLTFGAGKSGALGHVDTNKRAVGRPVKALAGRWVHAAAFGAGFLLALAGWRPPAGKGSSSGGGGGVRGTAACAAAPETPPAAAAAAAGAEAAGTGSAEGAGFRYAAVEPPPSPRSPAHRGGSSVSPPGEAPSTPVAGRGSREAASSSGGGGVRLRGRSGREQRREEREEERRVGRGRRRHGGGMELPDAEGMTSRRQRWMAEPPLSASQFTPPGSDEEEEGEGGRDSGGGGGREMAYLLRRQVKVFATSPQQRDMLLPRSLTSCDRWRAHVLAESWGLMHESTGEGASRRLVLWKPSRSRRSLKPSMLQGASSDSDGGDDAPSSSGGGGSSAGPSNAAVGT